MHEVANLVRGLYVRVISIVNKKLQIDSSIYSLLQILSVTLFEKMSIKLALHCFDYCSEHHPAMQLIESMRLATGNQFSCGK